MRSVVTAPTLTRAGFWILVATVLLSPLPLGSARPWAWSFLALAIGGAGAVWGVGYALNRQPLRRPAPGPYSVAAVLFMLVMLWALFQTLPILSSAVRHPLWTEAEQALGLPLAAAIALDTESALVSVLRLMTAFLVFSVVAFSVAGTRRAEQLLAVFGATTTLYALAGLWVFFTGNATVAGLPKWAHLDDLTGTFANRNSFATFAGMGFLCLVSLVLQRMKHLPSHAAPRVALLRAVECLLAPRTLVVCMGAMIMLAALLLSHSRAGLFSTLAGLGVLLLLAGQGIQLPRRLRSGLAILLFGVVLVMVWGGDGGTIGRVAATDLKTESRPEVYHLTLSAIGDAPMAGYGLGSFGAVFPLYRDATVAGYYDRAHSDHLELLLDLGLPMAVLLYAGCAVIVGHCWRGVRRRRRNKALPALGVAVACQVTLHACVDFSLQIPAVALLCAAILGLSYAQATRNASSTLDRKYPYAGFSAADSAPEPDS